MEGIENCTKCHTSGKQLSADKCLSCHTLLRDRIKQKKGLHAQPDYNKCDVCHIEHQGRDFDLIYWKDGKNEFNHELTGYKLEGAHSKLECEKCHTVVDFSELAGLMLCTGCDENCPVEKVRSKLEKDHVWIYVACGFLPIDEAKPLSKEKISILEDYFPTW